MQAPCLVMALLLLLYSRTSPSRAGVQTAAAKSGSQGSSRCSSLTKLWTLILQSNAKAGGLLSTSAVPQAQFESETGPRHFCRREQQLLLTIRPQRNTQSVTSRVHSTRSMHAAAGWAVQAHQHRRACLWCLLQPLPPSTPERFPRHTILPFQQASAGSCSASTPCQQHQ